MIIFNFAATEKKSICITRSFRYRNFRSLTIHNRKFAVSKSPTRFYSFSRANSYSCSYKEHLVYSLHPFTKF